MKIELFLDGHQVEINQDIDFVLNKQFTELTDLTSIIVDYSKTIKVPMTPHNNELFNYIYKLEHQVIINTDIITYDPSRKISMAMTFNGSLVMEGYALLNSIDLKDKMYEINLYGQLGKIFSDLKEKPLKGSNDGITPAYHIPANGWSKNVNMHTYNIERSFKNQTHTLNWNSQDWTDFFGFAPQLLGDSDVINKDCYEAYTNNEIKKFADDINTTRGIDYADVYVKDGFDLNQYGEVRTYTCRPYVYVDKIIQMVQAEINQGDYDGYSMVLDNDWFNAGNPYYYNMVFFPGTESLVDGGNSTFGQVTWDNTERTLYFPYSYLPTASNIDLDGYTYTTSGKVMTIAATSGDTTATITLNADGIIVRDVVEGVGDTTNFNTTGKWAFYNNPDMDKFTLRYIGVYDGNGVLIHKLYLCDDKVELVRIGMGSAWTHYTKYNVWSILKSMNPKNVVPNSTTWVNGSVSNDYCEVTQLYNFGNLVLNNNSFQFKLQCDLIDLSNGVLVSENIAYTSLQPLCPFRSNWRTAVFKNNSQWSSFFCPVPSVSVSSNNFRSRSIWTIYDILGNDFNPFTWLIDYVKKFRLFFDIDYMTKTITLKRGYFNNITYKQVDVDYSKDITIEPIVDKYSIIDFGYATNESRKGVQYKKTYSKEYGDEIITTGLNINNERLSLISNKDEGVFIPVKMNCINWPNLNSNNNIRFSSILPTNSVITTLDSGNTIQYFPFYAFRTANAATTPTTPLYLTDDSPNQKNSGEYCYLEHSAGWQSAVETTEDGNNVYYEVSVYSMPQFDNYIIFGNADSDDVFYWVTFRMPREVYNGFYFDNDYNEDIYEDRWRKYLDEIFNIQNKKITCYVRMSYPEFINFKFNQLFVIDNCTFLVNKIIDFNPNQVGPTKVELIQISEVTNLQ